MSSGNSSIVPAVLASLLGWMGMPERSLLGLWMVPMEW
jgi:hypothetical protein